MSSRVILLKFGGECGAYLCIKQIKIVKNSIIFK